MQKTKVLTSKKIKRLKNEANTKMPNKIVCHNYKAKVAKSKLEAAKMKIRRRDKVYRTPTSLMRVLNCA